MSGQIPSKVRAVLAAVLETAGATAAAVREAALDRAASLSGAPRTTALPVPEPLAGYVDKVALHAYRTTDEDIAALKAAGHSEDAIFEITLSAALGAGLARLELGLAALRAEETSCDSISSPADTGPSPGP